MDGLEDRSARVQFESQSIEIRCFEQLSEATPASRSEIVQVEKGEMHGRLRHVSVGPVSMGLGIFDRGIVSKGVFSDRDVTFGMLFETPCNTHIASLRCETVSVWPPGVEHLNRYFGGAAFGGISVPADALSRFFGEGCPVGQVEEWAAEATLRFDAHDADAIDRALTGIVSQAGGNLHVCAGVAEYWTDALLDALTRGVPRPEQRGRCGSRRSLYDILEYLDIVDTYPVHVARLMAVSGLSRRSLFRLFDEEIGVSPVAFLRQRQLCRARTLLKRPDSGGETIADIAFRSGFCDFGRFSAYYRAQFGEYPSQTVKRHRSL
ncbi:helix-turn-helix domain-containing protein [Alsobacter sp. KACC 23698]|uniref:Helix-turn-helix domain-containing protein n=1 Tax=Alsobacter sp. KACC 23698 TaxID=3149229 RepID=A0AAU7JKP8_9HYPH